MKDSSEKQRSPLLRKLAGWKSIGRHLGRSERAVQLWEVERSLPVHRIPGGRGQTVFAYAEELDAWMNSSSFGQDDANPLRPDGEALPSPPPLPVRPPGILVLPFENHDLTAPTSIGDAICQHLIERLAEVQRSVRVLSWQTSKNSRHWAEPLQTMSATLNVRYLVEGSVDCSDGGKHVDVRVVDAELDHVVLADRFVCRQGVSSFQEEVAEAVAIHFALIHEGALVEPMCLAETAPATMIDYLRGARTFFEGKDSAHRDVLESLERALARDPNFTPARAMIGIALLQAASLAEQREACTDQLRTIAAICNASTSARVTAAFLNAAIAMACDDDRSQAELQLSRALGWLSPAIPSRGRLYERRSSLRPRGDGEFAPPTSCRALQDRSNGPVDVFANLLQLLADINHRVAVRNGPFRQRNAAHQASG